MAPNNNITHRKTHMWVHTWIERETQEILWVMWKSKLSSVGTDKGGEREPVQLVELVSKQELENLNIKLS